MSENTSPQIKPKKVLIVEDDFYIRDLYTIEGKLMNFEIIIAKDGEEALEKIKNHHPNVVLLDLMLPKIDGMTVLRTVKSDPSLADIKLLIVTNLEDDQTEEEAKKQGASGYLLKMNFSPRQILEEAQKQLPQAKGPMSDVR